MKPFYKYKTFAFTTAIGLNNPLKTNLRRIKIKVNLKQRTTEELKNNGCKGYEYAV